MPGGCYGNSAEDRARERQLNEYLESTSEDENGESERERAEWIAEEKAERAWEERKEARMLEAMK